MIPGAVGKGGSWNRWGYALLMGVTFAVGLFVRLLRSVGTCVHPGERPV